jgi:hypothetical protein
MRKCTLCTKSQVCKDAEWCIAFVEAIGEEGSASTKDIDLANSDPPSIPNVSDKWCCMYHILVSQEDFRLEKPLIQLLIKDAGHVCLFLP